jgi:hypothetical protein
MGLQGANASTKMAILPDISLQQLSYTDSFLMNLFTIAYARASVKKGPNNMVDQRENLPVEFLPRIHGMLMALWDAKVTM